MRARFLAIRVVLALFGQIAAAHAGNPQFAPFYRDAETLLTERRFVQLDAMAADLKAADPHFRGGDPKLYHFYKALAGRLPSSCGCGDDTGPVFQSRETFEARRALLQDWLAAARDRTPPVVALAQLWRTLAWKGRGSGYVAETGDDQWASFENGLRQEEIVLRDLNPRADPAGYHVMLSFARDTGGPRDRIGRLYDAAVADYPRFFELYLQHANILLPKWLGQPGDLKVLGDAVLADHPGGDDGLVAYDFIADYLTDQLQPSTFFAESGLSWDRIELAFARRKARYGVGPYELNAHLWLAYAADDRTVALGLLREIGEAWDPEVFHQRIYFDKVAAWARG
jgi:hypothetical protein